MGTSAGQPDLGDALYRDLVHTVSAIILVFDPRTTAIRDANLAACQFYGYSRQTLTGMHLADLTRLSPAEIKAHCGRLAAGERICLAVQHRLADGSVRDVEVRAGLAEADGQPLAMAVIHDITEHKRLAERLRDSERPVAQAQRTAPAGGGDDAPGGSIRISGAPQDTRAQREAEISLKSQVSELTLLNRASRLVEDPNLGEPEICRRLAEQLAQAALDPPPAAASVALNGARFIAGGPAANSQPPSLFSAISAGGQVAGQLALYYPASAGAETLRPAPAAAPEVQVLLDNLAILLGQWLERRNAETEIRKLSRAVEQSSANIVITDREGRIDYVNPAFLEGTGYTFDEVRGRNPRILQSGHTPHKVYEQLWQTILAGRTWHGELQNRKKNGELYWESIVISPLKDPSGAITHFVSVKEDVTERKRDQQRIADALDFNRTIVQSAPIGILIYTSTGECVSANPAAGRIVGTDPQQLMQQNVHTLSSWRQAGMADAAERALNSGKPAPIQLHIVTSPGRDVWLTGTLVPFDAAGEQHLMLMIEDETERQEAQAALVLANDKLNRLVQELEDSRRSADLLRQMGELLQACQDMTEAYQVLNQFSQRLFPGTRGAMYLIPRGRRTVEAAATWGDDLASEPVFAVEDCWALRLGRANLVRSAQDPLKCRHMDRNHTASYLDIPMYSSGDAVGLLHLEWPADAPVSDKARDVAHSLADTLALSLANITLRNDLELQSIRDRLTGVYHREYVEESALRELTRAGRRNSQIGVILIDVDRFRRFNEANGKAAGDLVLGWLGRLLKGMVRGGDIVGRLDDDRFVIVLPETSVEAALQRAESIRAAAGQPIEQHGRRLEAVTVSLGVAIYPTNGTTWGYLKEKASWALSQAKQGGGNRVAVAVE